MRILVAEDHPELGNDLKQGLEYCSYSVDLVANGDEALAYGLANPYDLIILDILLPALSGLEVCLQLRKHERVMPILFLTALGEVDQRVKGLDLGGDDYLTKPFDFRELEARVRALLRRGNTDQHAAQRTVLRFMDVALNTGSFEATRGERRFVLSNKEYELLKYLMSHPNQILSRSMIAEHVWREDIDHLSNVIEVYIRNLRHKLCADGEPNLIQTVWGVGYQLKELRK